MSDEVIGSFFERLEGDEELQLEMQTRVQQATSTAIASFAAEQGFEFTGEQLADAITKQVAELDEDELEAVAGGGIVVEDRPPYLKAMRRFGGLLWIGRPGDTPWPGKWTGPSPKISK
jgi:predicted ribosomally synthesized peptide with nif11-like leader